jgi:hypothetical protein
MKTGKNKRIQQSWIRATRYLNAILTINKKIRLESISFVFQTNNLKFSKSALKVKDLT